MLFQGLLLIIPMQIPEAPGLPGKPSVAAQVAPGPVIDLKLLEHDAWGLAEEPKLPAYPPLAHIARIQGEIVVLLVVGPDGNALRAKAVKGPMQLRACAESYLRHLQYKVNPGQGEGPWAISITMRFDLKDGIGFAATGQDITMHRAVLGSLRLP